MRMINQGGQIEKLDGILSDAVLGLQSEAKSSKSNFGPKLLSQASALSALILDITKGKADASLVKK